MYGRRASLRTSHPRTRRRAGSISIAWSTSSEAWPRPGRPAPEHQNRSRSRSRPPRRLKRRSSHGLTERLRRRRCTTTPRANAPRLTGAGQGLAGHRAERRSASWPDVAQGLRAVVTTATPLSDDLLREVPGAARDDDRAAGHRRSEDLIPRSSTGVVTRIGDRVFDNDRFPALASRHNQRRAHARRHAVAPRISPLIRRSRSALEGNADAASAPKRFPRSSRRRSR